MNETNLSQSNRNQSQNRVQLQAETSIDNYSKGNEKFSKRRTKCSTSNKFYSKSMRNEGKIIIKSQKWRTLKPKNSETLSYEKQQRRPEMVDPDLFHASLYNYKRKEFHKEKTISRRSNKFSRTAGFLKTSTSHFANRNLYPEEKLGEKSNFQFQTSVVIKKPGESVLKPGQLRARAVEQGNHGNFTEQMKVDKKFISESSQLQKLVRLKNEAENRCHDVSAKAKLKGVISLASDRIVGQNSKTVAKKKTSRMSSFKRKVRAKLHNSLIPRKRKSNLLFKGLTPLYKDKSLLEVDSRSSLKQRSFSSLKPRRIKHSYLSRRKESSFRLKKNRISERLVKRNQQSHERSSLSPQNKFLQDLDKSPKNGSPDDRASSQGFQKRLQTILSTYKRNPKSPQRKVKTNGKAAKYRLLSLTERRKIHRRYQSINYKNQYKAPVKKSSGAGNTTIPSNQEVKAEGKEVEQKTADLKLKSLMKKRKSRSEPPQRRVLSKKNESNYVQKNKYVVDNFNYDETKAYEIEDLSNFYHLLQINDRFIESKLEKKNQAKAANKHSANSPKVAKPKIDLMLDNEGTYGVTKNEVKNNLISTI